ncbi:MAG: DUF3450 domain-containing protein [Deltaproteobacteria bacterium]|nr:DUF3450 domain-containing protein [Deltaproteobacteria bacterium]MBW2418277.1 DUF3450 domain-containing protein [Deltaproteobacteria bacterium]
MTRTRPSRRLLSTVVSTAISTILLTAPAVLAQDPTPQSPAAPGDSTAGAPEQLLEESREVRRDGNVEGAASQKRVEDLSDTTEKLFARYSNTLRQVDSINVYNGQMEQLVASQLQEIDSISSQLDRVEEVGRSVTPLMLRMIDSLGAFIKLDIPFLIDERKERIANLREMMSRADVTNAEKFRSIMEAYQIENEFGRTIEAYRATLPREGKELTVDFLRFGRVALVYQTIDESEAGVWDQEAGGWRPLDSGYRTAIRQGLRIARKQAAPDMIRLPLPAAQPAGGAS